MLVSNDRGSSQALDVKFKLRGLSAAIELNLWLLATECLRSGQRTQKAEVNILLGPKMK